MTPTVFAASESVGVEDESRSDESPAFRRTIYFEGYAVVVPDGVTETLTLDARTPVLRAKYFPHE